MKKRTSRMATLVLIAFLVAFFLPSVAHLAIGFIIGLAIGYFDIITRIRVFLKNL